MPMKSTKQVSGMTHRADRYGGFRGGRRLLLVCLSRVSSFIRLMVFLKDGGSFLSVLITRSFAERR